MKFVITILFFSLIFFPPQVFSIELVPAKPEDILNILEDAMESAAKIENRFLGAKIYDQIATSLVELEQLEKAIAIANRKDNVASASTLHEICRYLIKHGKINEAFNTAKKVKESHYIGYVFQELAPALTDEHQKIQALILLHNALSDALQKEGFFKSSLGISLLGKIAEAQYLLGNTEASLRTVQELLNHAKSAPEYHDEKDQYFKAVAEIQAKIGAMPQALSTLQKIQDIEYQQKALRWIAQEQVWSGHIPQAKELIKKLHDPYDRDRVWKLIVDFYIDIEDFQNAFKIIDLISHSMKRKTQALINIAHRQRKLGDTQSASITLLHALKILESIKSFKRRADLLGQIARIQEEIGDHTGSTRTLAKALEAFQKIRNHKKKNYPLLSIIQAHAELGDIQGGLILLKTMPTEWYIDRAANWLAYAQAKKGDIEGALQTALLSKGYDFMWRGMTLQKIAKAQAQNGDYEAALIWAKNQIRPSDKAFALLGVAQGLLETDNL